MIRSTHFQSGGFERVGSSPSIIYLKQTNYYLKDTNTDQKITTASYEIQTEEIAKLAWKNSKNKTHIPHERQKYQQGHMAIQ
jgi:hypothetical protein